MPAGGGPLPGDMRKRFRFLVIKQQDALRAMLLPSRVEAAGTETSCSRAEKLLEPT